MTRFLFSRKAPRAHISGLPRDQREFYEHLGEEADVQLEPGYNQDEIFDDQFERRAHEKDRTPGSSSAISIVPSKRGPWTSNGQLGIERAFAPDENNRQTVLRLDEWGFPEIWTLCLGLTYDADLYASGLVLSGSFGVVAEIEFGTGGVIQQVEIDWRTGASICLPMNAVNVIASFSSVPTEGGVPVLPQDLRLRANIVHGMLPQACPTRTYTLSDASEIVQIPPFAKSFRVVPQGELVSPFDFYSALDTVELQGLEGDNAVAVHTRSQLVEYLTTVDQLVGAPVYIDIPEMARFLQVSNPGQQVLVQFRIGV